MKTKTITILSSLILLTSCHSEYRVYKRAGGDHLILRSDNKALFWFNGIHARDPQNPMFDDIKDEFTRFAPDVVLVEGHANLNRHETELSARKAGESEYVSYLAAIKHTDCFDLEPADSTVNRYLITKFGKKDVLTMYVIRQMIQWGREKKDSFDFEQRVVAFVASEDRNIGYFSEDPDLSQISELLRDHTGIDKLNNENWRDFDAKKYLYYSENSITRVYNDIYNFRNLHLVKTIELHLEKYDRIFIMMGFDHARDVENDLLEIFNSRQSSNH